MSPMVIVLDEETETLRFLVNEDTQALLEPGAKVARASHVEPKNAFLRFAFHTLRLAFGEKGSVAAFTRLWPCIWRVNLAPSGGPILSRTYTNRGDAIEAEIEWLQEHFL